MASADILEPFAQNNEIFDTEMEDLSEGAQDGVLVQSPSNDNPKSPAKVGTLFTKDDIFDDESSLQSSLDSGENSKGVECGDSEVSRLVVDESSATQSGTEPALDNNDLFDDEKSPRNSCSSDNEDEENETDNRTSSQRSPKPRRLKKAAIQSIHSECQKMLRESVVRLPYHQPAAKPITDFLKRVPIVKPKDVKLTQQKVIKNSLSDASCDVISDTQPSSVTSDGKTTTPKLSDATDSFFLNETPTEKRPVKGVQSLMQRFAKHTTKPPSKSKVAIKTKEADAADAEKQSTDKPPAVLLKEKIEKAMPGERLKILKQQLESKMKVQRAEMRKIYESQRRLDNEEMSEEEEEEEMTDEESDSDYELDKWNEEDEKKQEEEDGDDDDSAEKKNDLIDEEADEDDDSKASFDDINSGSDGDVSDEGNSDDDEDKNSVFSDDEQIKHKKRHKVKKQKKTKENTPKIHDERTIDLFNVNSNSQTDSENCNTADKDAENTNSESTEPGLCLRLDSIEEDEEGSQDFTKTKECKSAITAKMPSTVEESSQSSFSFHMTSDPEETNESSRIQPGQGEGNNRPVSRGSESSELLTMFPKISRHINGNQKNTEPQNKKAGKLSQLTLPIEDSQDLFYDESTGDNDEEKAQEQVTVSKNFSFTLDEDTQFTQMLDTQGFLFSTSKPKSKSKDLLEGSKKNSTQGMEEILGLCSGKFSGLESMPKKQSEKPHSFFDNKMKNGTQGMEEILGLCSGNFSGLESMPEKQSEKPHSFFGDKTVDKNKSPNMDELIGLCSGQFVSDKSTDEMSTRKMKPRSLLGTAIEGEPSKSSQMDELLDLCSGAFPATEKPDTQKKTNSNTSLKLNTKDREEGDKKESDSNNKEEEEGEDTDVEAENEENPNDEKNDGSERDEESEGEDSDVDIDIDEMRKKKKYQRSYGKIFNKKKFYEEEAELSGSDIGSDEDLDIDTDEDVLEEDSDQEQLPSDEELQKQITKVHMKSLLDQDKTELRFLQDMYLQDGDLHGEGRKRNFRWRGIDSNSQMDLFDNKLWSEEDHGNIELLTEEECKRRKERYERDTFLREEMSKTNQGSFVDMDENSQVILNFIKDTSNASPALVKPDENPQQTKPKTVIPPPRLQRIPSQKGSFLNRSKATLSRLSSITANTPNASSGRTFVFKTVDSADKIKTENSKKMPRTTSLIEPSAKRPKLDRSLSDTSNSIFAML